MTRPWPVPLAGLLLLAAGCAGRASTFQITDYLESGQARHYRETFDEAYYDLDGNGNMDIVLRRSEPGLLDPGVDITQVIHIHTVWRSVPGDTVAERTQINGTVSYHIIHGRVGAKFEGGGSVFFSFKRGNRVLEGSLDLARLRPISRLPGSGPFFERTELSGKFRAVRDRRQVVRITNEMDLLFTGLQADGPSAARPSHRFDSEKTRQAAGGS